MLLDKKTAEKLVEVGLDWLVVSIDGATPGTHEKNKNGSKLDRILENVRYLVSARKTNQRSFST